MLTSIKFKTYVFVCFIKTSAIYAVILIMMSTNNIVKWPNAILQKKHTFIMKCLEGTTHCKLIWKIYHNWK